MIVDAPQNVFQLFGHDAPAAPLPEVLQSFLQRTLDCFGQRFAGFLGHLPRQTFRFTTLMISVIVLYSRPSRSDYRPTGLAQWEPE